MAPLCKLSSVNPFSRMYGRSSGLSTAQLCRDPALFCLLSSDSMCQLKTCPGSSSRWQLAASREGSQEVVGWKHALDHGMQLLEDVGGSAGGLVAMPAHHETV